MKRQGDGAYLGLHESIAARHGLRALREARKWTPDVLAAELGEDAEWVRRRETGSVRIRVPEAERLAQVLGTDTQGLIRAGEAARTP